MKISKAQAENICEKFSEEKVICGIKDSNIQIKFINSNLWLVPLLISFALLIQFSFYLTLAYSKKILFAIIFFALISLSIYIFLKQSYTLYFDNKYIILKNKLNKKKIFDISKFPRIYTRHTTSTIISSKTDREITYHNYELHIQQNEFNYKLDIQNYKTITFLNNLELKTQQEITKDEWNYSASQQEKNYSTYTDFLKKQEKVIGVKYPNNSINILNFTEPSKRLFICIISAIICYILVLLFHNPNVVDNLAENFFMFISVFSMVLAFAYFISIVDKGRNAILNISYPSPGKIKINKYLLNYEQDNIIFSISYNEYPKNPNSKYAYSLDIYTETEKYSIPLDLYNEEIIGTFIDNLIFEPKEEIK